MAYCEIPHKDRWSKGNNWNSWYFRPSILCKRKSQCNCKLIRKPVHAAQSCDTDNEGRVEARVQALLTTVDENPSVKFRPCDVWKEIRSLKLEKACGIDDIPNEYLRHLPRRALVHITHLFNHCLRPCHFPALWKEAKSLLCQSPARTQNSPKIYVRLASCPLQTDFLRN
jgi:hypothetical protein